MKINILEKEDKEMNKFGYTPICSGSTLSKTDIFEYIRDCCALF